MIWALVVNIDSNENRLLQAQQSVFIWIGSVLSKIWIVYQLTITYNNLSNFSFIHLMNKGVFVKCAEFVYLYN